jgi:site-specific recombinase XerC
LTVLRQALNWAMVNDLVSRNVASPVKAPRQVKGKKAHWTREQMDTFRDVADADPLAACWRLTLLGLRVSEIRGLLWENVDLDAGEVKIRRSRVGDQEDDPKSVAGKRDIPVDRFEPGTAALLRALKRQQAADKLRCGSAWQDRKGHVMVDTIGQVISAEAYRDRFHRLCRTADLSTIDLHAVRHSFGTYLNTLSDHHDAHASVLGHTLNVFLSIYSQSAGREGIDRAAQAVENARSAV